MKRSRTVRRCLNCVWYCDDPLFVVGECYRTKKPVLPDNRCIDWQYTRNRYMVLYRERNLANMKKIVEDLNFLDDLVSGN